MPNAYVSKVARVARYNRSKKFRLLKLMLENRNTQFNFSNPNNNFKQRGQTIYNTPQSFGNTISMSDDGSVIASGNSVEGNVEVAVYNKVTNLFELKGNIIYGDALDAFGEFVSLSGDGNRVAVSAKLYDDFMSPNTGYVVVYEYNVVGNQWTQVGSNIKGSYEHGFYGRSALSQTGNIVAITSMTSDDNGIDSGHIEMYKEQNGQWVQMGDNIAGENAGDNFGGSIALSSDGSVVAAGAIYASNDSDIAATGHVRAFQYLDGSWSQIGSDIDGIFQGDLQFTVTLSSDGSIMAVGAYGNDGPTGNKTDAGSASVYKKTDGAWIQMGETIYGKSAGDYLGAVAISSDGTVLAVGSFLADSGAGKINLFYYDQATFIWTKISAAIIGKTSEDSIGATIAISSDGAYVAISSRNIGYIEQHILSNVPPQQPTESTQSIIAELTSQITSIVNNQAAVSIQSGYTVDSGMSDSECLRIMGLLTRIYLITNANVDILDMVIAYIISSNTTIEPKSLRFVIDGMRTEIFQLAV